MEHHAVRWLAFLLGGLLLLPHLAWGQYTGAIPPGTVMGNIEPTARPAVPQPFSSFIPNPISNYFTPSMTLTHDKTGGITTDAAALTALSNATYTANQIYRMTTPVLVSTYDAIRGVAVATPGTTNEGVNGIAGYVMGATPQGSSGSGANPVAVFGVGVAANNSASVWGINTLLTDHTSQVASVGVGRELWNELDFNVTSPNTTVRGLVLTGASIAQPALAVGLEVRPLGAGKKWTTAIGSQGGSAINGLAIGTRDDFGVPSSPSQLVLLGWTDGSGAINNHTIYSEPGRLILDSTALAETGHLVLMKGGLRTTSGGSMSGLVLGRQLATGASDSQSAHFEWTNATGAAFNHELKVTTDGVLNLITNGAPPSAGFNIPSGARYIVGGVIGVTCAGLPTASFAAVGGIVTAC